MRVLLIALLAARAAAPGPAQQPTTTTPAAAWTPAEEERFLLTAQVEDVDPAGKGITGSLKAMLSDGMREHAAHIQSVDLYMPLFRGRDGSEEREFKDTWKFNVAAYRLARLLHLTYMVPVSVARPFQDKPSAFTWWVDGVTMDERERLARRVEPPDAGRWNAYMETIRVFDQLIFNTDRSQENLLITKDWSVWMIDHTRAFRIWPVLRNARAVTGCNPQLLRWLKALDRGEVAAAMGDLLTAEEIDGLMARRDLILGRLEEQGAAGW